MVDARNHPIDEEAIAEAAIWVARLQSDQRPAGLEAQFRAWLAADDRHRAAFEAVSDTWELSGGARIGAPEAPAAAPRRRLLARPMAIAAAVALFAAAGLPLMLRPAAIETAVGEQRSLKLPDGTMMMLNTATELRTRFSDDRRVVILDHGEASFEVAKDSLRPFIVEAGPKRIVALGTVFDVRWTDGRLAVTLAEGKVRVVDEKQPPAGAAPREVELAPGQRLEQPAPARPPRLERVDLAAARAWRQGQVVFTGTPLSEAAREMNRYSDEPLLVEGRAAKLQVSGAFRAGDTLKFAQALADIHGLHLRTEEERLILSDAGQTTQ